VSGSSACIANVVYLPGYETELSPFFSDISDVLERIVTFNNPIYLVGDVNICLERSADSATIKFTAQLESYGFESRISEATNDRGGMLDIVATCTDLPSSPMFVVLVGLSDWCLSVCRFVASIRFQLLRSRLARPLHATMV